jgi:pre-rRNA-processing protein TSR3
MEKQLSLNLEARSLPPGFQTAYPRRQTECPDPMTGLASVEALYLAYWALGEDPDGLLDFYHWKEKFLEINSDLINYK